MGKAQIGMENELGVLMLISTRKKSQGIFAP